MIRRGISGVTMGLTIHYNLQSDVRTTEAARKLVDQLRDRALTLPFEHVTDVVELADDACDFDKVELDDPNRWLLVQAGRHVEVDGTYHTFPPLRLIAFMTAPGRGCEPANFGLCQFPQTIRTRDHQTLSTGVSPGWSWQSFCKTQYASNPRVGGIENFLKCHTSIVRLLDAAGELGLKTEVTDEGGYWENRSVEKLTGEIGRWNQAMAGFVGQMKDVLGSGQDVQAEITHFPNYEHLEAEGRADESEEEDQAET